MSSPGSGKTSTLKKSIPLLMETLKVGVMEADIDSDVDAETILKTGAKVIQLHTGGMCHLDAEMTKQGLEGLGCEELDLVILENVGNLVCPAEFDTGAVKNVMILSVPEGDDKPLKYPLMFSLVDVLLINKIDTLEYFNFDLQACIDRVKRLNENVKIITMSAKTGEGIEEWADWLKTEVNNWKKQYV
jgi:hydrogenase nickel incorporation protein HypB